MPFLTHRSWIELFNIWSHLEQFGCKETLHIILGHTPRPLADLEPLHDRDAGETSAVAEDGVADDVIAGESSGDAVADELVLMLLLYSTISSNCY